MASEILIYGANGFTGRLIAKTFKKSGLRPLLAGRDATKIGDVAASLDLPHVSFDLDDRPALDAALSRVVAVLHCAGPFSRTSRAMVDACLRAGTHYLDITGELDVMEECAARSQEAIAAGIMLLPGSGFDVVPSDCLAVHLAGRMPDAVSLRLSISFPGVPSHGTMATGIEQVSQISRVRRAGKIVTLSVPPRGHADFGSGTRRTIGIAWGDVSTAFHSTHIPNIDVEFELTPQIAQLAGLPSPVRQFLGSGLGQSLLRAYAGTVRATPDDKGSPEQACVLLGEVKNRSGEVRRSRLNTPGAYWLTAQTTLLIARRVQAGNAPIGFQTAASAYGSGLILEVPGTAMENLD